MQVLANQKCANAVQARAGVVRGSAAEAASVFFGEPTDQVDIGSTGSTGSAPTASISSPDDPDRAAKESLIRGMIRKSPHESVNARIVDCLCRYPLDALQAVSDYGTKIECYDFEAGDAIPEYLPTLGRPNCVGAYNTKANVLGFDRHNVDAFTVLHEFAHALDMALNGLSGTPDWVGSYMLAVNTNRTVRDYAKSDSSEYMAENTCAYLVPDEKLPDLVERGLQDGALGLPPRQFMQLCQNLSHDRLRSTDPDGFNCVDALFNKTLKERPRRPPQPAMTVEQYHEFRLAEAAARGAS